MIKNKKVLKNIWNKSAHVHLLVILNNKQIPYSNSAKYLGITLDAKLRWRAHVTKKREELEIKYKKMYWLIGGNANLQLHNKLFIYRQVLKPVWTYGIQLWGCSKQSNKDIIQRFHNKVLRNVVCEKWGHPNGP